MSRGGNGDDVADLTLRLLREIRTNMATKTELAAGLAEVRAEVADVRKEVVDLRKEVKTGFAKLETRIDVVARIVKDNYRVLARRIRAVEVRVGARRPR